MKRCQLLLAHCALLSILLVFFGCSEEPTVVAPERLTFLERAERPLMLEEVIAHLGPTHPHRGPLGFGMFYGYAVRGTQRFLEFWYYPPPDPPPGSRTGDAIPLEILLVLEISPGKTDHIIWPRDLIGRAPQPILKATYPEQYK